MVMMMPNVMQKRTDTTLRLVSAALCTAMCVILPWIFHSIPNFGTLFSPIHLPVLLAGLLCGWPWGLACGILGPILSSIITGMPPAAYLPPMLVECAVYGLIAGLLIRLMGTKSAWVNLYISLISAMIAGRIVAGLAKALFFAPGSMTLDVWFTSYFLTTLPGMAIQLALLPALIMVLRRFRLAPANLKNLNA